MSGAAALFAVLVALAAATALGLQSLLRPAGAPAEPATPLLPILIAAAAATAFHALLVRAFPLVYYLGADSDDYLQHALNLIDHRQYRIAGRDEFFETVRTPGYAGLIALVFLAFGKTLAAVTLTQAVLLMAAVGSLAAELRRWVPAALLAALVLVAAIMPPNIELSRAIQSDGPAGHSRYSWWRPSSRLMLGTPSHGHGHSASAPSRRRSPC
jgi:hypothetical protein